MKNNDKWGAYAERAISPAAAREVKGGYKKLPGHPGGVGSTGMVNWGEIEVRTELSATGYGSININPAGGPSRGGN